MEMSGYGMEREEELKMCEAAVRGGVGLASIIDST